MQHFRLLTFTLALLLMSLGQMAAQCTPDPNGSTTPGIYPADSLPHGEIGVAYSTQIDLVLPRDTMVDVLGVPFSASFCKFKIDVLNLPNGLTAECDAPGCEWTIDHTTGVVNRGCVVISGTPTDTLPDDTLRASITITPGVVDTAANLFCDTDSLRRQAGTFWPFIQALLTQPYGMGCVIEGDVMNMSIAAELRRELQLSLYPNPSQGMSQLRFQLGQSRNISLSLHDLTGRQIRMLSSRTYGPGEHLEQIPLSDLNPGVYLLQMKVDEGKALIVEKLHLMK
jgi:hypothetical protein